MTTNYDFNAMFAKLSRMPKTKALAIIATEFPGYEATDVYTVRDNLTAAIEHAEAQLKAAEEAAVSEIDRIDTIDSLLADLHAATTKSAKKNIRAKLRRQGYRISDHRGEE